MKFQVLALKKNVKRWRQLNCSALDGQNEEEVFFSKFIISF